MAHSCVFHLHYTTLTRNVFDHSFLRKGQTIPQQTAEQHATKLHYKNRSPAMMSPLQVGRQQFASGQNERQNATNFVGSVVANGH